jgi:hypothetical protein
MSLCSNCASAANFRPWSGHGNIKQAEMTKDHQHKHHHIHHHHIEEQKE